MDSNRYPDSQVFGRWDSVQLGAWIEFGHYLIYGRALKSWGMRQLYCFENWAVLTRSHSRDGSGTNGQSFDPMRLIDCP